MAKRKAPKVARAAAKAKKATKKTKATKWTGAKAIGKGPDPLFQSIKVQIEAARDKLREEAKAGGKKLSIHRRFLRLQQAHHSLGFGKLSNIIEHG